MIDEDSWESPKEEAPEPPKPQIPQEGDTELPNKRHEAFANLVAAGMVPTKAYVAAGYKDGSYGAIASSTTHLMKSPKVVARIAYLKPALCQRAVELVSVGVDRSVLEKAGRLEALLERRARVYQVLAERAAYHEHQDVPGGKTGLVVTSYKSMGKNGTLKTHEIDIATLELLANMEKQIAVERGQWTEKTETTHRVGAFEELIERGTPEEIAAALELAKAKKKAMAEGAGAQVIQ